MLVYFINWKGLTSCMLHEFKLCACSLSDYLWYRLVYGIASASQMENLLNLTTRYCTYDSLETIGRMLEIYK